MEVAGAEPRLTEKNNKNEGHEDERGEKEDARNHPP